MPAGSNKALVRRCRSLLGLLFLAMLAPLHAAAQAPGDHAPMTRDAFDALFARVDNTGRWGELDQMGTLNLITPEVRLQAFQEVRDGGTVSLAHELVAGPIPGAFEEMRAGIVTRAVLVDVPRLRDIPDLAGDVTVTVADLEAWEQRAGIRVRSGDVLLIRFGHLAREAALDPSGMGDPMPRIHPSVALWLQERGVSALGADFNDGAPSLVPGINTPLHVLALVAMGMPLFDNMELEELAREAADRSRYSFLFMASPLWIRGATGSPLNPLAVF